MEVILKEDVAKLGSRGDVVKVAEGYGRNYLLPRGKAYEVTPASLRELDNLKKKRAERETRELNEAEELSHRIGKLRVTFTLETGETGKAFGSVTTRDIEEKLQTEYGITIDRHKIELERPIKESGEKEVSIKLHHNVSAILKIEIKSSTPVAAPHHEESESAEVRPRAKRKAKPAA